jgi:hypothetical protein
MGFIPGFEMTLPQQNFTNLTRDDINDVLRRVKCSTPAGELPTEDELTYMYHVCVTKCDDYLGKREEGDEDGVNIFDMQFAYSTFFVLNDRPVDIGSRVDQFFAPIPDAAVGMDDETDAAGSIEDGSISDTDLFIIMNDLVGNLVTPIANASIMVNMEAPPAYDEDDDFDELPDYDAAVRGAGAGADVKVSPDTAAPAVATDAAAVEATPALAPELLSDSSVTSLDVARVKRMADFTESGRCCHDRLCLALNYWVVEHDMDEFREWDSQPQPVECCAIA